MNRKPTLTMVFLLLFAAAAVAKDANPRVAFETSMGRFVIELEADKAPKSVANILGYVDDGFYDGTVFHRVIADFMVQTGGFDTKMDKKATGAGVENEAANGLSNVRGSVALARTQAPHSATSQFFVNVVDNTQLDPPSYDGWGYTVFAHVVEGMEVIDAIAAVPTQRVGRMSDVPVEPVIVETARRVTAEPASATE